MRVFLLHTRTAGHTQGQEGIRTTTEDEVKLERYLDKAIDAVTDIADAIRELAGAMRDMSEVHDKIWLEHREIAREMERGNRRND